jgi:hypothetical protein
MIEQRVLRGAKDPALNLQSLMNQAGFESVAPDRRHGVPYPCIERSSIGNAARPMAYNAHQSGAHPFPSVVGGKGWGVRGLFRWASPPMVLRTMHGHGYGAPCLRTRGASVVEEGALPSHASNAGTSGYGAARHNRDVLVVGRAATAGRPYEFRRDVLVPAGLCWLSPWFQPGESANAGLKPGVSI